MTAVRTRERSHYRIGEVAGWLGLSNTWVAKMYDEGELDGFRTKRGGDRRVSRKSLLRYAMANRIQIPEIGMYPYSIVMIGVDHFIAEAIQRAAAKTDAQVQNAVSEAEFGLMLSNGETCCGVVSTSIGTTNACTLAQTVRRHSMTRDMLLIAIAAEDMTPVRVVKAGYDHVYRQPFNVSALVRRIAMAARKFQESAKAD